MSGGHHHHGRGHAHGPGHDHEPGHDHGPGGHHHAPPNDWRYGAGVGLNLAFVAAEVVAGLLAHSTALLADAGHNLSDVLGLALAGIAAWLARRPAAGRRTYGFGKATVLAALANAVVLAVACLVIAVEAVRRLANPEPIEPGLVMLVAAIGVLVNGATALMFMAGRKDDVNVRGAYLHMAADAGVSAGVIVAGLVIAVTGWTWIDPAISLVIVAVILVGTWGLLSESVNLALDAVPAGLDLAEIEAFLAGRDGVTEVHDLHVWAMSTTETALTCHLVRPDLAAGERDGGAFRRALVHDLGERFGVRHVTLQIETTRSLDCADC